MTITCGIQPTNVVTMAMKVLHNSCNMCTLDLTDVCTHPWACGPMHARIYISGKSLLHMHVTTIAYTKVFLIS